MNDVNAAENDVSRSIRPAEAVKAWERITQNKEIIRAGAAARVRSFNDWIRVLGPFVRDRVEKTKAITGTTRGTIYSAELQKQMGQFWPIYKKQAANGTMSFLTSIMDNLQAVEEWMNSIPSDERPHHPRRVWEAYEVSRMPIVAFKDAALTDLLDPTDEEVRDAEEEDESEDKPARKKRSKDAERERRVEELEEELGKYRLSTIASDNASRIWLALRDIVGHEAAVELARATADELMTLVDKVEGMWREAS